MTKDQALDGIRKAAKEREEAKKRNEIATAELRRFVQTAREAGVQITLIAEEAGLSRQGVYDLLASD